MNLYTVAATATSFFSWASASATQNPCDQDKMKWAAAQLREQFAKTGFPFGEQTAKAEQIILKCTQSLAGHVPGQNTGPLPTDKVEAIASSILGGSYKVTKVFHPSQAAASKVFENTITNNTTQTISEKLLGGVSAIVDYVGTPAAIAIAAVITVASAYGLYSLCCTKTKTA